MSEIRSIRSNNIRILIVKGEESIMEANVTKQYTYSNSLYKCINIRFFTVHFRYGNINVMNR